VLQAFRDDNSACRRCWRRIRRRNWQHQLIMWHQTIIALLEGLSLGVAGGVDHGER
jgi:hypothetical protein